MHIYFTTSIILRLNAFQTAKKMTKVENIKHKILNTFNVTKKKNDILSNSINLQLVNSLNSEKSYVVQMLRCFSPLSFMKNF